MAATGASRSRSSVSNCCSQSAAETSPIADANTSGELDSLGFDRLASAALRSRVTVFEQPVEHITDQQEAFATAQPLPLSASSAAPHISDCDNSAVRVCEQRGLDRMTRRRAATRERHNSSSRRQQHRFGRAASGWCSAAAKAVPNAHQILTED